MQVTQFQNDPGLYFEGLGTVKQNTAEWKMLVYYDLTPFVSEIKSLSSGLQTLQQMCPVLHQEEMCNIFVNNLKQMKNELLQEKELFVNRRLRRSPFNIVGNIARSLFGVLDADYAEEISKTINRAKNEHDHMSILLKNQTSIIDSTINIIKQDEISNQRKIQEISEMVDRIKNDVAKESSQLSNSQLVGLLSTYLALSAINLQRVDSEIISVLTDTHSGKISPLLLSPHQLKEEISVIKANLPISHALPTAGDNLIELYKLMSVKGAVTKYEVIFEVRIPLVNQQFFELFKVIPVPTIKNDTLIAIQPETSYMATDAHRDEYILFQSEDISRCLKPKDGEYICKNQQSKLRRNAAVNPCEINVFNNHSTTNCKLNRIIGTAAWSQLHRQNSWIFATTADIESSIVCGTETSLITIKNTGIMEIGSNCVMKNNFVTIHGHFEASNSLRASYVRLRDIHYISSPQEVERVLTRTNTTAYKVRLEELENIQRQLNESTLKHLPQLIHSTSLHHHAVSYTSLLCCVIIMLGLLSWKIHSRLNKTAQVAPTPAVRTHPSTISVPADLSTHTTNSATLTA
ncbi:uncharacterized protein [Musca autumnalis]|uniref:uncharacterized protein n=1 Tax=Musca autumnalis TaxID=221902 RepID=UPI003CF0FA4D